MSNLDIANKITVNQLPHSKSPQNPTIAPGMKVSGFYNFATITVSKKTMEQIQKGTGINLF
jgi:hypothetical protein